MKTRSLHTWLTISILLTLWLPGCRPAETSQNDEGELKGTLTVSGAWALYPMMVRWGDEFQKVNPAVAFDISAGGAGKGMSDVLAGAVDIGMISREIYPEEIEKGAYPLAVTKDAVFLTVNEQNPVWDALRQKGLSPQTLTGIFISGEITTWGQVIGRPEMTDPIHVFTRSDACGAAETWAQFLGGRQEDLTGIGVYGDPGVLDAVINDPLAIGYNNLNYAFAFDAGLPTAGARVAPIDNNGNGTADPDEILDTKAQAVAAISSGFYPSPPARDLYLVTLNSPTDLTQAFVAWVLTDGQQFIDEVGYIPLSEEVLAEQVQKLK